MNLDEFRELTKDLPGDTLIVEGGTDDYTPKGCLSLSGGLWARVESARILGSGDSRYAFDLNDKRPIAKTMKDLGIRKVIVIT
jgi:hypothetical protein